MVEIDNHNERYAKEAVMNSDFSCLIDPDSNRSLQLCDGNLLGSSGGESMYLARVG